MANILRQPDDLKYVGQRAGRGIANIFGGLPDLVNTVTNAGLRNVGYLAGYQPDDVYQFPYLSDQIANKATEMTGADIVKPEEVSRGARLVGQGAEMGTEILADPVTYATAGLSKLAPLAAKYGPQLLKAAGEYGPEAAAAVKAMFIAPGAKAGVKAPAEATRDALAATKAAPELAAPAVHTSGHQPMIDKIFAHAERERTPKYTPATEPVFKYDKDGGLAQTKELVPQFSIADRLPPTPQGKYPEKGRAEQITQNVEGISDQIVKDLGPLIQSGEYKPQQFYSTGPVIQGLSDITREAPLESAQFMNRWSGQGAATSPRTATPSNLRNASYLMFRDAQGNPLTSAKRASEGNRPGFPMMGMHTDLGEQFLKGTNDLWKNPKPGTFQTNWAGNLENLTADTHYIRKTLDYLDQLEPGALSRGWFNNDAAYKLYQEAGGFPKTGQLPIGDIKDTLGGGVVPGTGREAQSEYQILQQPGLRAAEKLNKTPAEVQAAMWFVGGPRTNLKSPDQTIPDLLNSQIEATSRVTGLAPEMIVKLWRSGSIPLAGVGGATAGASSLLSQPGGEQKQQEY